MAQSFSTSTEEKKTDDFFDGVMKQAQLDLPNAQKSFSMRYRYHHRIYNFLCYNRDDFRLHLDEKYDCNINVRVFLTYIALYPKQSFTLSKLFEVLYNICLKKSDEHYFAASSFDFELCQEIIDQLIQLDKPSRPVPIFDSHFDCVALRELDQKLASYDQENNQDKRAIILITLLKHLLDRNTSAMTSSCFRSFMEAIVDIFTFTRRYDTNVSNSILAIFSDNTLLQDACSKRPSDISDSFIFDFFTKKMTSAEVIATSSQLQRYFPKDIATIVSSYDPTIELRSKAQNLYQKLLFTKINDNQGMYFLEWIFPSVCSRLYTPIPFINIINNLLLIDPNNIIKLREIVATPHNSRLNLVISQIPLYCEINGTFNEKQKKIAQQQREQEMRLKAASLNSEKEEKMEEKHEIIEEKKQELIAPNKETILNKIAAQMISLTSLAEYLAAFKQLVNVEYKEYPVYLDCAFHTRPEIIDNPLIYFLPGLLNSLEEEQAISFINSLDLSRLTPITLIAFLEAAKYLNQQVQDIMLAKVFSHTNIIQEKLSNLPPKEIESLLSFTVPKSAPQESIQQINQYLNPKLLNPLKSLRVIQACRAKWILSRNRVDELAILIKEVQQDHVYDPEPVVRLPFHLTASRLVKILIKADHAIRPPQSKWTRFFNFFKTTNMQAEAYTAQNIPRPPI